MNEQHVQTVLRAKAERYEYFTQAQQIPFQGQLTKALLDKSRETRKAAEGLIIEFNIYHPQINPFGNR